MSNRRLLLVTTVIWLLMLVTLADAQRPGRSRGRFPFGFGQRGRDSLFIAAIPEVQRELQVRSEQEELLEALLFDISQQQREALRRAFNRPSEGENASDQRRRFLESFNSHNEKLLSTIFDPPQAERFNELRL